MNQQIFRKTLEPFPERHHCLLLNEFKKLRNNKTVTMAVTRQKIFILYERGTMKVAEIDFELRFQLRSEMRQLYPGYEETVEHEERIFVLTFEKPECGQIEFYNKNQQVLNWRLILKERLNMLNYQHFYQMERLIGSGSFASVYVAKRVMDNELFAAKAFYKKVLYQQDPKAKAQIQNEINMLRHLSAHSHISTLFEVYENQTQIYLIIELCLGGTLEDLIAHQRQSMPQNFIKHVFYQLLVAVQFMHNKGIMHRDLKPANILFRHAPPTKQYMLESAQVSIVLSDFGIATPVTALDHIYSKCGSPGYMAPEVFDLANYTEKVDVFSLGCILYEMLSAIRLFNAKTSEELIKQNQECFINYDALTQFGEIGELLATMLDMDPEQRPSVLSILNDSWFQDKATVKKNRPKSSPPKRQAENHLPQFKIRLNPIHPEKTVNESEGKDRQQKSSHQKRSSIQKAYDVRDLSPVREELLQGQRNRRQQTQLPDMTRSTPSRTNGRRYRLSHIEMSADSSHETQVQQQQQQQQQMATHSTDFQLKHRHIKSLVQPKIQKFSELK